jgi:hypothetical protein
VTLSPEEKATRERDRLIETAKQYGASSYCRKFVAPVFQRMIRAEAGAEQGRALAIVDGKLLDVSRKVGQCVCITCGKVDWWDSGIQGIHTGHFLASRRNSILLEEDNVAPQCSSCNFYRSGAPNEFRQWMVAVRGLSIIERLEQLKRNSVTFERDQLVDMRIKFNRRLKAAESKMKGEP